MNHHGRGWGFVLWVVAIGVFAFGPTLQAQTQPVRTFSVLTYNVKGNGVTNWTTNSLQVRAIGRQMAHLQPDVITFQEIPQKYSYEMTNFVNVFLPGYSVVYNSATDGSIRSAIASRYKILRSTSWLARVGLTNFGYSNVFTRDLFEAEIQVPGFPTPVHVFTVHLKSGQTKDDAARRAAEAAAISNFFVTGFLTTNANRPYLLTGDLNDSNVISPVFQALLSPPVGLYLTTPRNPVTASYFTFSIQADALYTRYDYVLPCGLFLSNIVWSIVYRTDLDPTRPEWVLPDDSVTASDHLPVLVVFANPFDIPFRLISIDRTAQGMALTWESAPTRTYNVEASTDLTTWTTISTNIGCTSTSVTVYVAPTDPASYYRVFRQPLPDQQQ